MRTRGATAEGVKWAHQMPLHLAHLYFDSAEGLAEELALFDNDWGCRGCHCVEGSTYQVFGLKRRMSRSGRSRGLWSGVDLLAGGGVGEITNATFHAASAAEAGDLLLCCVWSS